MPRLILQFSRCFENVASPNSDGTILPVEEPCGPILKILSSSNLLQISLFTRSSHICYEKFDWNSKLNIYRIDANWSLGAVESILPLLCLPQ